MFATDGFTSSVRGVGGTWLILTFMSTVHARIPVAIAPSRFVVCVLSVWAGVCALAVLGDSGWPMALVGIPAVCTVIACAARPVHARTNVLLTTDGGVFWRGFLRPYGRRLLLPFAFGAVTYCGGALSWLLWPSRGVGAQLFTADAYLQWWFPLVSPLLSLAGAFLVLLAVITPVVAAHDAYSQRSTETAEALRLSGYVSGVIGFAFTIVGLWVASAPTDESDDRLNTLADEARLLLWRAPNGNHGASLLAWSGVAAWIAAAALFIRANRRQRI